MGNAGSDAYEPPAGVQSEFSENPALIRARRFRKRRFSADRYLEDDSPARPGSNPLPADEADAPGGRDSSRRPEDEEENTENQDTSNDRKRFRTHRIRIRKDGIDPASLV